MDKNMQKEKLNRLARILYRTVYRYYEDAEHRKEFEKWHLREYGTPYHWKTSKEVQKCSVRITTKKYQVRATGQR